MLLNLLCSLLFAAVSSQQWDSCLQLFPASTVKLPVTASWKPVVDS
jgi:hypothetical protein